MIIFREAHGISRTCEGEAGGVRRGRRKHVQMKGRCRSARMMSILAICSFLLYGACGLRTGETRTAAGYSANLPGFFTVSAGDIGVKIRLAAYDVGEIDVLDLNENTEVELPLDGVDMIYFEGIGAADGEIVPFHYRCDGNAWLFCAEKLLTEQLGDCDKLEVFVGELPVENYTVTYVWGEARKSVTVSEGELLEQWIPPVPAGERFLGWYLGETENDFSVKVHRDMTLNARFEKALCQLTYYVDDTEWAVEIYEYGTEIELKSPEEKDGCRFVGWENRAGIAETVITIEEDLCFYAVWMKVCTVSFYDEEVLLGSITVDEGETGTPIPAAEREGYEFAGWFLEDASYDFSAPIRKDTILVAKYRGLRFQIDFYIHGAVYFSTECTYPNRLELFAPPPIDGEVLRGWYYEDGRTAQEGDAVTADLILTAVYEKAQATIHFRANGNSDIETEAVYGEPCVLPSAPQATGSRFLYWSEEENGEEYLFPPVWTEVSEREFYAVYAVCSYTITYLSEGAIVEGPTTGEYGERISFSVTLEREFRIGRLELCRNGVWEELEDRTFLMPAENVQIRVTAESRSCFSEVIAEGVTYRVECGEAFNPPTPERENQIFLGWFTDIDCMKEFEGIVTGEEGKRIYLFAKFEKVKFTIAFCAGEREERILCEYGETPSAPFVPWEEDTAKRFVKWSPSVAEATDDAVYVAVYESVYTKIYFDDEKEIFRETAALSESSAPTLVREGYVFEGYKLERQESNVLYYRAQFSETPKTNKPLNAPVGPANPTDPQPTAATPKTSSPQSSNLFLWILLAVLSLSAWIIYIGFRIYRTKQK